MTGSLNTFKAYIWVEPLKYEHTVKTFNICNSDSDLKPSPLKYVVNPSDSDEYIGH